MEKMEMEMKMKMKYAKYTELCAVMKLYNFTMAARGLL